MEPNRTEGEIMDFIAEFLGADRSRIQGTTSLLHDLDVDGDDGPEFLTAFAKNFSVDLSDLQIDLHFGSEGTFKSVPVSVLEID